MDAYLDFTDREVPFQSEELVAKMGVCKGGSHTIDSMPSSILASHRGDTPLSVAKLTSKPAARNDA